MAKKSKGKTKKLHVSVSDKLPEWDFLKKLKLVRTIGFDNGSVLITGTIPRGKNKKKGK